MMNSHAYAMISRRAGFTVIELMITVAIIAILATVAAPSMRDMVKNARMTSLVNDLMSDLSVARAEAVKRGVPVSVCTSTSGTACTNTAWNLGWIVFTDGGVPDGGVSGVVNAGLRNVTLPDGTVTPLLDVILKVSPKINGADENPPTLVTSVNSPTATGKYVIFRPTGVTTPGGGAAAKIDFYLCDSRRTGTVPASEAANKGRHIIVSATGRAQSNRCTCANDGASCAP
jgi:prepilin-type N-terminal cleavage/methylation domain-containing protein